MIIGIIPVLCLAWGLIHIGTKKLHTNQTAALYDLYFVSERPIVTTEPIVTTVTTTTTTMITTLSETSPETCVTTPTTSVTEEQTIIQAETSEDTEPVTDAPREEYVETTEDNSAHGLTDYEVRLIASVCNLEWNVDVSKEGTAIPAIVIMNRMNRTNSSAEEICYQAGQFSCINKVNPDDAPEQAIEVVKNVFSGYERYGFDWMVDQAFFFNSGLDFSSWAKHLYTYSCNGYAFNIYGYY